jgi:hypothetical protein
MAKLLTSMGSPGGTRLMARSWLIFLGVVSLWQPLAADAQHYHGGFGFHGSSQPWVVSPGLGYSGYAGPGYGRSFYYQTGNRNLYYDQGFYSPQIIQPVSYSVPANSPLNVLPKSASVEPSKVPVVPSTPAARLRSLEHQARGDQRLRQQKWSEARAAYRSSVDAAPDRAEGHLRLGLCLVAIQRFEPAIHEFKRALFIDPLVPRTGQISKAIFGPDSQMTRSSIISKLTDWVRDDYTNPDRLFLMGVILHFEGDPRGLEFFEAAKRMKRNGDVSHIELFMGPAPAINDVPQAPLAAVPKLNDKPVPIMGPQLIQNDPQGNGARSMPATVPILPPRPAMTGPVPKTVVPLPGAPVPMPDL